MPRIKGPITECPTCGSEVWDNRGKKKNPKSPDFKCKADKEHAFWLETPKGAPAPPQNGRTGWTAAQLGRMYAWATRTAGQQIVGFATAHKIPVTMENVVAGAATVFIGATTHLAPPPAQVLLKRKFQEPVPPIPLDEPPPQLEDEADDLPF
jgi:hypothetical protein